MEEMGQFKCLRRQNETTRERENYTIFRSSNSMDESWHLDRNNGGNRSLNETDIRRAMIDSRFHHDEASAIGCCYNSSQIPRAKGKNKNFANIQETHEPDTQVLTSPTDRRWKAKEFRRPCILLIIL